MLMITGGALGIIMYNVWLFGTQHGDVGKIHGTVNSKWGRAKQLGLKMMTQEWGIKMKTCAEC